MRHFCIITNSDKGANAQIAQRAVQYLRAHDADCVILPNFLEETPEGSGILRRYRIFPKTLSVRSCLVEMAR